MSLEDFALTVTHEDVEHDDAYKLIFSMSYQYTLSSSSRWFESILNLFETQNDLEKLYSALMTHIKTTNAISFFPLPDKKLDDIHDEILMMFSDIQYH